MDSKHLYIYTIGCQMNTYDSSQIAKFLGSTGYAENNDLDSADMIVVNTCSIRQKAEQKAFSFLGRLSQLKRNKPQLIVAIGGCVAQQEGKKILSRMPFVDLVFGTHAISRLPALVRRIEKNRTRIVDIGQQERISTGDYVHATKKNADAAGVSTFVTIMRGCDNYCTYCVVPFVRGRESSRDPESIVEEIKAGVKKGIREVTLLGQNVNSYGKKEGLCSFSQLLERVNTIAGLKRIRFTTSHPKDLSDELVDAFKNIDKLCNHIHLPVQSGSTQILKRMNRKYSRDDYLEKVAGLRDKCPDIAITSDIIVGFPGETDADFEDTISLIRRVEYDGLFAFMYSDRPNAPAARFDDKIPEAVKSERLQVVLGMQKEVTMKKHLKRVGTVQEVLVEGMSKKNIDANEAASIPAGTQGIQWTGRTADNKIVNFDDCSADGEKFELKNGILAKILIKRAFPHSLWGYPVSIKTLKREGERSYAA